MRIGFKEINEINEDKSERSLPTSDNFSFPKELKVKSMFAKELHVRGFDNEPTTNDFKFPKELKPRF